MTFTHRLLRIIIFAMTFTACIFTLRVSSDVDTYNYLIDMLKYDRFTVMRVALCFLCLGFLYLLTALKKKKVRPILTYENEGGAVSISNKAIEEMIGKLANEFTSVLNLRPRIFPGRNSIDIALDVRLKSSSHTQEICEALQHRVRESMKSLGILEVRQVIVNIQSIIPDSKSPAELHAPASSKDSVSDITTDD
jgi:uncharacterized alkaline shock family protein YloU